MDAIKFINEQKRMCASYTRCQDCPLFKENALCSEIPSHYPDEFAAEITKAVEDWSAAHPANTRAELFKKSYPHSPTDDYGALFICPLNVGETITCTAEVSCPDCRKKYWLKEVQNGR